MREIIQTDKAPAPIGAYNQAVLANGTLYVSGQIALDAETGKLITEDIESETHKVLSNLKAIVEAAGMTLDDVSKCSVFVSDMGMFGRINKVYAQYFDEVIAPARELVEVVNLPKYVNVEISCIASK
jgi:2-iminobutanoate/2-iminopropanoate deaminase